MSGLVAKAKLGEELGVSWIAVGAKEVVAGGVDGAEGEVGRVEGGEGGGRDWAGMGGQGRDRDRERRCFIASGACG